MSDEILRLPAVLARVGLSRSTVYHLANLGQFPRPIRIGQRARGWLATEITEFLASRAADRDILS